MRFFLFAAALLAMGVSSQPVDRRSYEMGTANGPEVHIIPEERSYVAQECAAGGPDLPPIKEE